MKRTLLLPVIGAAAMLALPVGAFAQSLPNNQPSPNNMQARIEQHVQQLHNQLEIRPAQQRQWDQFAQSMAQNADDMQRAIYQRGSQLGSMNAVQNMQSYTHLAELHAQDMERLSSAFQQLYDSMSPQQRQNADQVFRVHAENRARQHGRASG